MSLRPPAAAKGAITMTRRQWEAAFKIGLGVAIVWLILVTYWLYTVFHDVVGLAHIYG